MTNFLVVASPVDYPRVAKIYRVKQSANTRVRKAIAARTMANKVVTFKSNCLSDLAALVA